MYEENDLAAALLQETGGYESTDDEEDYTGPIDPPENSPYAIAPKLQHAEVSMNDQLVGLNKNPPKYRTVPPEKQQIVLQHETAPIIRIIRGDDWPAIAKAENGKYWRIVEQEEV